jgi:hypothetical protein
MTSRTQGMAVSTTGRAPAGHRGCVPDDLMMSFGQSSFVVSGASSARAGRRTICARKESAKRGFISLGRSRLSGCRQTCIPQGQAHGVRQICRRCEFSLVGGGVIPLGSAFADARGPRAREFAKLRRGCTFVT